MKFAAIYLRRSIESDKSLSIEAQRDECVSNLKEGEKYKIYCDNGISGKDITHRPNFQRMLCDVREGIISRIIVKKYDRFTRNLRDLLNVMDELSGYGVTVTSVSEPMMTETANGKLTRNILMAAAEYERETTAARVKDNYYYKARETGFFQGGRGYTGYCSERRDVDGRKGCVLVPDENSEMIRIAFKMYTENSLAETLDYLRKKGMVGNMRRSNLGILLKSPLYVRADKEIYAYFASRGIDMIDDISAYDGVHGLLLHTRNDKPFIKVGYHEGLVDSETWLAVQDKKEQNYNHPKNGRVKSSWLTGLVKCAHCGKAIAIRIRDYTTRKRYYYCTGAYYADGCGKTSGQMDLRPDELEEKVFEAMQERIKSLEIAKKRKPKSDNKSDKIKAEIIRIDDEIRGLMEKLAKADNALFDYINKRITELHSKKSDLEQKLQSQERKRKEIDTKPLAEPLSRWNELSLQEKHDVASLMIEIIRVADDTGVEIRFNF